MLTSILWSDELQFRVDEVKIENETIADEDVRKAYENIR